MNLPSGWELVLVLLVIVVVFGSKRLPDSARALGRSMRILKAETKGLHDDDGTPAVGAGQPVHSVQPAQPVQSVQSVQSGPGAPTVGGATGSSNGSVPVAADGALRPSPTTEQQRQP